MAEVETAEAAARRLESEVREGGVENANALAELIVLLEEGLLDTAEEEGDAASLAERLAPLHALRRTFAGLLERGDLRGDGDGNEALAKYVTWLKARYMQFLETLVACLGQPDAVRQVAALRTLMFFVQHDSLRHAETQQFGQEVFRMVLVGVLTSKHVGGLSGQLLRVLAEEYVEPYVDVRYHTLGMVGRICSTLEDVQSRAQRKKASKKQQQQQQKKKAKKGGKRARAETQEGEEEEEEAEEEQQHAASRRLLEQVDKALLCENAFDLLYLVPGDTSKEQVADDKAWWAARKKGSRVGAKAFPGAFQEAWVGLLRLRDLPRGLYRKVLLALPLRIMPHLANPLLLSDFLTDAYEVGGITSVMALSSLFKLISENNLDYPKFYAKLYKLLTLETFFAKHRGQFFELLDKFLSSAHLASYLVAAFAKKISRIALSAPPGSAMFAVVLVSNLLKKHPTCLSLVHVSAPETKATSEDINADKRSKLDSVKEASLRLALGAKRRRVDGADADPGQAPVEATEAAVVDPFVFEEDDPALSHASDSCLWEIEALARHVNPNVSTLVQTLFYTELRETLKTKKVQPPAPIDEFLTLTYKSLFDREIKKGRKKNKDVPVTFRCELAPLSDPAQTAFALL